MTEPRGPVDSLSDTYSKDTGKREADGDKTAWKQPTLVLYLIHERFLSLQKLAHKRLIHDATHAAPNPLSILTTVTFDEQELSIPSSAAKPPKLAP